MTAARFGLLLTTLLVECAPAMQSGPRASVVVERLYFGRNVGDSLAVTDSAWDVFLAEVVTPRFPSGLTAWSARGQWRDAAGRIVREPSFVVEIVHSSHAPHVAAALDSIVADYKRRFRQESVLRVVTPGQVVPQ